MNSVGLENPGIESFIEKDLDWINEKNVVNIVNLGGHSKEDYYRGVERLNDVHLDLLELNISCPNVKEGGMNFGVKTEAARELVREVRKICRHKLVVKLSPNAEDIVSLARMCEEEGADGVSLTNTFLAMAIDIKKKAPVFNNGYAGLSGPAISQSRCVWYIRYVRLSKYLLWDLAGLRHGRTPLNSSWQVPRWYRLEPELL